MRGGDPLPQGLGRVARGAAGDGGGAPGGDGGGGDDAAQRGLPEAGRPGEQEVVDRLASAAGRLEDDAEVLFELALADEVVEVPRTQATLLTDDVGTPRRVHHAGGQGTED